MSGDPNGNRAGPGGIAIHRNFDVDGLVIGGRQRSGPAFHVFGAPGARHERGQLREAGGR